MIVLAALVAMANAGPFDRLAGSCWRGTIAARTTDTHCFRRDPSGMIRDDHVVDRAGTRVYWGRTRYRHDAQARGWRYDYVNADGPVSHGIARAHGTTIDFVAEPPTPAQVRWRLAGRDRYVVETIAADGGAHRVTFRRLGASVSPAPAPPR